MKGTNARRVGVMSLAAALWCSTAAFGQDGPPDIAPPPRPSLNLFGVTGLIDTPTAEGQPDAQLSLTAGVVGDNLRNTLSFQILPRVEGTFRYSILPEYFSGGNTLYDRSFDVKFILSRETDSFPALAIGLQDFLGTGVYSGEYIVGTKEIFPGLKLSGGVGWGRFAAGGGVDNPLGFIRDSFKSRTGSDQQLGQTGQVRVGRFFRGEEMGIFGGLEWQTPVEGLSVKAEYSADNYARDFAFSDYDATMPVNLGFEYRLTEDIALGGYFLHGNTLGLRATFTGNPTEPLVQQDQRRGPPLFVRRRGGQQADDVAARFGPVREAVDTLPAAAVSAPAQEDVALTMLASAAPGPRWADAPVPAGAGECPVEAARRIDADLGVLDGVTFRNPDGTPFCTVVLRPAGRAYISAESRPVHGWDTGWAADPVQVAEARAAAIEAIEAEGLEVDAFELTSDTAVVEIQNPRFLADAEALGRTATVLARRLPDSVETFRLVPVRGGLPLISVTLRRALLEEQAGDADQTRLSWAGAEFDEAAPGGRPDLLPGRYPEFSWSINPHTPFGLFDPDSPLRTDLQLRVGAGVNFGNGLSFTGRVAQRLVGNLDEATRRSDSVLPHVRSDASEYAKVDTPFVDRLQGDYMFKILPDTYGRVSAGLFETMFGGVSGEVVWKPEDQNWGLGGELNWVMQRDFDGYFGFQDYNVVTGHASIYWDTGWHDINTQVDVGRYLAKDLGATFTVTRTFSNGWQIGGFFTLTDVPFDEFGEGSFDKGLILTIPLGWAAETDTRLAFSTELRPLTRDGGQRLRVANRLYGVVSSADRQALRDNWSLFWK